MPVGGSGVAAGHALVVSLLLSSTTHLTTAVSATDSAGNSYAVGRDTNDGSSGDRTVVLVTHNMFQASRVSQFTGFFLTGELVEFGPTGGLFEAPNDPRTDDYIRGRFG